MMAGDLVEVREDCWATPVDEVNEVRVFLNKGATLLVMLKSSDMVPSIESSYTMLTLYHARGDKVVRLHPSAVKIISRSGVPWPSAVPKAILKSLRHP